MRAALAVDAKAMASRWDAGVGWHPRSRPLGARFRRTLSRPL